MKYCRTFRPSRKFAVIGVSMIEPSGLAIRPRMPASWRICAARAARAGVGHHVDGVERLLLDFLAVAVDDLLLGQLAHHDLADLVAGLAPDVDHLVVALAGRHQARDVLLLDLLDFLLGALDQAVLLLRHQHVVDGDRDAGARGQPEAALQQLVGEHHRFLQAAPAERRVDQARDLLLLQRLVDVARTAGPWAGSRTAAHGRRSSRRAWCPARTRRVSCPCTYSVRRTRDAAR